MNNLNDLSRTDKNILMSDACAVLRLKHSGRTRLNLAQENRSNRSLSKEDSAKIHLSNCLTIFSNI